MKIKSKIFEKLKRYSVEPVKNGRHDILISKFFNKTKSLKTLELSEFRDKLNTSIIALQPKKSNYFLLEFDGKYSAQEFIDYANNLKLLPNIIYSSLKNRDEKDLKLLRKFKVIYVFDENISEEDYNRYYKILCSIFPKVLKAKNISDGAWFYGSNNSVKNSVVYYNEQYLDLIENNYIKNMIKNVALNDEKIKQIQDKTRLKTLTNEIYVDSYLKTTAPKIVDFKELKRTMKYECALMKEFYFVAPYKFDLSLEDKMILMSNLKDYNNSDEFLKRIKLNSEEGKTINGINKWDSLQSWMNREDVTPLKCASCSKFNNCKNAAPDGELRNIIDLKIDNQVIKKSNNNNILNFNNDKLKSIRSAMAIKLDIIDKETYDNTIHLFKVPTGAGKSYAMINQLSKTSVMAFPNHNLKQEKINEYVKLFDDKPFETLNVKDFLSNDDYNYVQTLYKNKGFSAVTEYVKSLDGGQDWLKRNNMPILNKTFTTHEKSLVSKYNSGVNTIVYDEDPFNSLFKIHNYKKTKTLSELRFLRKHISDKMLELCLLKLINKIVKLNTHDFVKNIITKGKIKKIHNKINKMKLNISATTLNLLESDIISKSTYSITRKLPDKKIIILSATLDIDYYKNIYKKENRRVMVHEFNMDLNGTLNQVLMKTGKINYSKNNYLKKNIIKIAEKAGADDIITYKKYANEMNIEDDYKVYMGNTSGFNHLDGKNTVVAATFRKPEIYYIMKTISENNINRKGKLKLPKSYKSSVRNVVHGRHVFKFYCFNDEDLRKNLFNDIDNEMTQAIGRSRLLLNKDTETVIVSDFIPKIVKKRIQVFSLNDYLKH